jgi:hypothetical protein
MPRFRTCRFRTYDGGMRRFLLLMAAAAMGQTPGQTPAHYVGIHLPDGVPSEKVFIRYILESEELGGVVDARAGVTDYLISTTRGDHAAALFKALVYAPGCAIQTVDLKLSDQSNPREDFMCRPVANAAISGRLTESQRLGGHAVRLEAVYVAPWAQSFLGIGNVRVSFPVGDAADIEADGRFRITVPLLRDDGEIQIRAKDRRTGQDVGQIVPAGTPSFKTRMGGLKIQTEYPGETVCTPCGDDQLHLIDREGFARRPLDERCDR